GASLRQAWLLARLGRDGGIPPRGRRRQVAGRVDGLRRAADRRLWNGHRSLWRFRVEPRIYPSGDRAVLRPPVRHVLSERAAAGRAAAAYSAGLRCDDGNRVPLGTILGPRSAALLRAERLRRTADTEAVRRVRHRRR